MKPHIFKYKGGWHVYTDSYLTIEYHAAYAFVCALNLLLKQ